MKVMQTKNELGQALKDVCLLSGKKREQVKLNCPVCGEGPLMETVKPRTKFQTYWDGDMAKVILARKMLGHFEAKHPELIMDDAPVAPDLSPDYEI